VTAAVLCGLLAFALSLVALKSSLTNAAAPAASTAADPEVALSLVTLDGRPTRLDPGTLADRPDGGVVDLGLNGAIWDVAASTDGSTLVTVA
jgi:hypothetical protein